MRSRRTYQATFASTHTARSRGSPGLPDTCDPEPKRCERDVYLRQNAISLVRVELLAVFEAFLPERGAKKITHPVVADDLQPHCSAALNV